MPLPPPLRAALAALALATPLAHAAPKPAPSALDAPLFYEILAGEMLAQRGDVLEAVQSLLAAAERARDGALYQRAAEVALQGRRADLAQAVLQTWQRSRPDDADASRMLLHVAVATQNPAGVAEPLARLLRTLALPERAGVIASVPRFLESLGDKPAAYGAARRALEPLAATQGLTAPVEVALGRMALAAGQPSDALARAQRAAQADPQAPGAALLALEMLDDLPAAEPLVQAYLAKPEAPAPVRLAYARALADRQHLAPAAAQAQRATQDQPDLATAWLTLAAYRLELREPAAARPALARFAALHPEGEPDAVNQARQLAQVMTAQAALLEGNLADAERLLAEVPEAASPLSTQLLRAQLLWRQGQTRQARQLLRDGPASDQPTPLTRLRAEAQLLREQRQWAAAAEVLREARASAPDDRGLTLEWAAVSEQLGHHDAAEQALRALLTQRPEDAHVLNALGYALADRGERLDEAQTLLARAHARAPRDPFITDSVGWLAFRQGRPGDALPLLQASYAAYPHAEVAAHLGEVLWALGRQDEARAIWREGQAREPHNEVLLGTLKRLRAQP